MKDIKKISELVEQVLRASREARNSDDKLYWLICENIRPGVGRESFSNIMLHRNDFGIPKYETVRRARQKVQAKHPELSADDAVTDERYENWKAVRGFAVS